MLKSQSLDEKFITRLREIIDEQQRHIDSLTYDLSENNKKLMRLIRDIEEISSEDKKNIETLNQEQYFLEKLNTLLELELLGKTRGNHA
jgi:hypothetical protein